MNNPIAYAYEADVHCLDCTIDRFGPDCEGIDSEGNEVGAIFPWDQWMNLGEGNQSLTCGTCGEIIDEYLEREENN